MNFFKTSFWASISTGVTMVCGLITTKFVAAKIGPAGMAYVGQFGNTTALIHLFASAACIVGVVKYVAESEDIAYRRKILSNALLLVITCTFFASLFAIIFSPYLSNLSFKSQQYVDAYIIYAVLLIFAVVNSVFSSMLNGLQQIKWMAILNVITSVLNVALILIGFHYFGISGVLVATFVSATAITPLYVYVLRRFDVIPRFLDIFIIDKAIIKMLFNFSIMSVVSGVLAPSIQMFIRSKLMVDSAANAGNWQACTRISDYYLNFICTVLGMYYMPKLASIKQKALLKREVWLGIVRVVPVVAIISFSVWLSRELVMKLLLTEEFRPMLPLLKWQLVFDVIKIASWMLAYLMWAKAMRNAYVITEIIFAITYAVFSWIFINNFGMIGAIYAFGANYTMYLITMLVLFRKLLFGHRPSENEETIAA